MTDHATPPSWQVFGTCPSCLAETGSPCWDLRSPTMRWYLLNPHKGRRQLGRARRAL